MPGTALSGHEGTPGEEPSATGTPGALGERTPTGGAALSVSFENGSANAADDTAPIIAENIEFDPTAGAIRLSPGSVLAYPDAGGIDTNEGTLALWVRPEWDPALASSGKALVELSAGGWDNRLEIALATNYLRFLLTTSDGIEHPVGLAVTFASNEWHQVAVTWGEPALSLYVDGALRQQAEYAGSVVIPPGTPLYVGTTRNGPRPGILSVRSLNVFQRRLADDEIVALFDQTMPK